MEEAAIQETEHIRKLVEMRRQKKVVERQQA